MPPRLSSTSHFFKNKIFLRFKPFGCRFRLAPVFMELECLEAYLNVSSFVAVDVRTGMLVEGGSKIFVFTKLKLSRKQARLYV